MRGGEGITATWQQRHAGLWVSVLAACSCGHDLFPLRHVFYLRALDASCQSPTCNPVGVMRHFLANNHFCNEELVSEITR